MKYTILWHRSAEAKLADLWNQGPDRQAISDAANFIDQVLAYAPETKGQEFYGDRYLIVPPLHVIFTVDPGDRKVFVLDVWRR
jgi:hypothetical protein